MGAGGERARAPRRVGGGSVPSGLSVSEKLHVVLGEVATEGEADVVAVPVAVGDADSEGELDAVVEAPTSAEPNALFVGNPLQVAAAEALAPAVTVGMAVIILQPVALAVVVAVVVGEPLPLAVTLACEDANGSALTMPKPVNAGAVTDTVGLVDWLRVVEADTKAEGVAVKVAEVQPVLVAESDVRMEGECDADTQAELELE
jgi:hypothetical protein